MAFLALKKYGVRSPYEELPTADIDPSSLSADRVEVARRLKASNACLGQAIRSFLWLSASMILIHDVVAFEKLFKDPVLELKVNWALRTSEKYSSHLRCLNERNKEGEALIEREERGTLRFLSRYFAIPKKDGQARAIFNGRSLSSKQVTPPPVGLPEIPVVLRLLADIHAERQGTASSVVAPSVYIADLRHFFHQIEVDPQVAKYFGVQCGEQAYSWRGLPMGWAHSPRIAQTISWSLVLFWAERIPCLKQSYDDAIKQDHPPGYVYTYGPDGRRSGMCFIWYDNFVFVNYDNAEYRQVVANINANRRAFNLVWSEEYSYSPTEMRAAYSESAAPAGKPSHPHFLGVVLKVHHQTRCRDGEPRSTLTWRVDDRLREKSRTVLSQWSTKEPTCRTVAQAIGVLVWKTYIYCIPLVQISDIITLAGKNVPKGRDWDQLTPLSSEDLNILSSHLALLASDASWHSPTLYAERSDMVELKVISDSSDLSGAYVIVDGNGEVLEESSWRWSEEQVSLSIFLKELLSAVRGLEAAGKRSAIVSVHLGIDNSAAGFVLRRGLSLVSEANQMLKRAYRAIPLTHLRVSQLRSEDNAVDALTRNRKMSGEKLAQTLHILDEAAKGAGRQGLPGKNFTGDKFVYSSGYGAHIRHTEETEAEEEYLAELVAAKVFEEETVSVTQ